MILVDNANAEVDDENIYGKGFLRLLEDCDIDADVEHKSCLSVDSAKSYAATFLKNRPASSVANRPQPQPFIGSVQKTSSTMIKPMPLLQKRTSEMMKPTPPPLPKPFSDTVKPSPMPPQKLSKFVPKVAKIQTSIQLPVQPIARQFNPPSSSNRPEKMEEDEQSPPRKCEFVTAKKELIDQNIKVKFIQCLILDEFQNLFHFRRNTVLPMRLLDPI
jgi:hypothetical protein